MCLAITIAVIFAVQAFAVSPARAVDMHSLLLVLMEFRNRLTADEASMVALPAVKTLNN